MLKAEIFEEEIYVHRHRPMFKAENVGKRNAFNSTTKSKGFDQFGAVKWKGLCFAENRPSGNT